jgi:nitrogen fixation NifU-like protein
MELDEELIEHMRDPKNYGEIENPDAIGIGVNPENGEKVVIYLKVKEDNEGKIIEDIKFQAIACMTTVVAGSVMTKEAKGISFEKAEELIAVTLGMLEGVPPEQAACTEMVALALEAAMDTYQKKKEDPSIPALIYKISNSCIAEPEANNNMSEGASQPSKSL